MQRLWIHHCTCYTKYNAFQSYSTKRKNNFYVKKESKHFSILWKRFSPLKKKKKKEEMKEMILWKVQINKQYLSDEIKIHVSPFHLDFKPLNAV